ncbi:hypothetical protein DSO57_1024724 [Entomophthora muscae]|uniref:Uncharacterized protein n=1 Tax=Entomophthora muscae TaxID=34485 RepID=A0ACC2TDM6_9FUNG|nr:hypothetical protein DSO57_1024724 [Entomophthora muscae]
MLPALYEANMSLPSFVAFLSALALVGCLTTLILQSDADTIKLSIFMVLVACGYYGQSTVLRILAKLGLFGTDQQLAKPKVTKHVRFSNLDQGPSRGTKRHQIASILKPSTISPTVPPLTLSFPGLFDIPYDRYRNSRRRDAIFNETYTVNELYNKNLQAVRDALALHDEVA